MAKKELKRISEEQGTLSVSKTVITETGSKKKQSSKKIDIRPFVTNTAHVSVKMGATIPTADFANVRLDIMLTVPCYVEEIVDVYKQTREMVEDLISREVDEIQKDLGEE